MEQLNPSESQNMKNQFCTACLFILKNAYLINSKNEITEVLNTSTDLLQNFDESELENKNCKFCYGILDKRNFEKIFEDAKNQIINYDYKDYKITTNFSPLFNILISYWKIYFKKAKTELTSIISPKDAEILDISLIRKIFKPFFIPFVESQFGTDKPYNQKSDLEIKIIFEFPEIFYDKIFNTFSFVPAVKKMGYKKFKPNVSMDKGAVNELIKNCSSDLFYEIFTKYKLDTLSDNEKLITKVDIINQNIYLRGNYLKFSREIGQSPWEVNGVKICNSSVEDEIKQTLKGFFDCDDCIMSAGGREDRDVRMLGSGRPFIMDISNPRRKYSALKKIKQIEEEVNKNTTLIKIMNLQVCDKNEYAVLKKYEDSKQKFYTCFVWASKKLDKFDIEKINEVKDLSIIQKTPMRVMHRRALMDRKKMIFKMEAKQVNENFMIVDVLASAGTYIKEFIHSDLGRTNPSLMSVLDCECDILQLDVMNIVFDN